MGAVSNTKNVCCHRPDSMPSSGMLCGALFCLWLKKSKEIFYSAIKVVFDLHSSAGIVDFIIQD